ncbi:TolC family protein [Sphingomonas sp. MMS24-JH45]
MRNVEASVFTDTVSAYENVIRDEAIVALNTQNVRVLDTNLRASRDRFEVGDVTRTDVAQSEARLRLAQAQLQGAGEFDRQSRELHPPGRGGPGHAVEPPPPSPSLPANPDEAVTVALAENPALLAARRTLDATDFDIRAARSQRLPQVGVSLSQNYFGYIGVRRRRHRLQHPADRDHDLAAA